MAYEYVNIKTDTIDNVKVPTKETLDARIPHKISELTNDSFVSYAEQTLTDEQKAQARTNIGAISEADLVQPDWNQNETAPDYVKNRPFYSEGFIDVTLLDGTFDFAELKAGIYAYIQESSLIFEEGKTYTVVFDGTSYSCTGYILVEGGLAVLGNASLLGVSGGNNEPFLIYCAEGSLIIVTNLTDASHTVKIISTEESIKKLDAKYLPDEIREAPSSKMDKVNPTGTGSFSLNRKANTTTGKLSFAEGSDTTASGHASHAEGQATTASGTVSHAEGSYTYASGDDSHAEGNSTVAGQMGFKVTACEKLTDTTGTYTLTSVTGLSTNQRYSVHLSSLKEDCGMITAIDTTNKKITVDGYPDIALSSSSSSTANYITIVDEPTLGDILVSGNTSHAEGTHTKALGDFSHAEGNSTKALGSISHAEGENTTASGYCSHAESSNTTASGEDSHAEGLNTTASGSRSHAEGVNTTASGYASHAEGGSTNIFSSVVTAANPTNNDIITAWKSKKFSVAKESSSHVEGKDNLALGNYSHAEGYNTSASGDNSHAEGSSTTASGKNSHAEGVQTYASGNNSHAEGNNTTAHEDYSHAEGMFTTAYSKYQHVQGRWNINDSNNVYADIIGNGSARTKSNAATVDWHGNAWYAGDVYVGSTSGTNKDAGSKKLATEEYVNNKAVTDNHINALIDTKLGEVENSLAAI